MPDDKTRIRAVLAALKKVHERAEDGDDDQFDTSLFNRWIDMLNGAMDTDCSGLSLKGETALRADFLMTVEAAIAFLDQLSE